MVTNEQLKIAIEKLDDQISLIEGEIANHESDDEDDDDLDIMYDQINCLDEFKELLETPALVTPAAVEKFENDYAAIDYDDPNQSAFGFAEIFGF